jgi:hypothetical protein
MVIQFTISRMCQLIVVGAVLCSLFATVWFPAALLILAVFNAMACVGFGIAAKPTTAGLAALTSILIVVALFSKGIGFETIGDFVAVTWLPIVSAGILELATILSWFLSDSSYRREESDH